MSNSTLDLQSRIQQPLGTLHHSISPAPLMIRINFYFRNCLIVKGENRVVFRRLLEKGCLLTPSW